MLSNWNICRLDTAFIILILLVFAYGQYIDGESSSGSDSSDCTVTNVEHCVNHFLDGWGKDQTSVFIIKRDEPTMRRLCGDFNVMRTCLSTFMDNCDEASKRVFEGVYDMYDYICSDDGMQIYLQHHSCFEKPKIMEKVKACNKTAAASFREIQEKVYSWQLTGYHTQSDQDQVKTKLCKTTDNLLSCMKDSVRDECGDKAADFAYTVTYKMIYPSIHAVHCSSGPNYLVWYAVCGAGALLSLALIGWCFGMYAQRRRRRHYTDQVALVQDAEPFPRDLQPTNDWPWPGESEQRIQPAYNPVTTVPHADQQDPNEQYQQDDPPPYNSPQVQQTVPNGTSAPGAMHTAVPQVLSHDTTPAFV